MRLRAKIGLFAAASLVVLGLVVGFLPRAPLVDVAEVQRAPMAVTVEDEGKTRVRDRYLVSAPVAGYARRIDLKAGNSVAAGQVLAVIEPARPVPLDPRTRARAQAQVRAAEAALAVAQNNARSAAAAAQLAQQKLARTEVLRNSNFVSAQALDTARSSEARARAAAQAAQNAVKVARFDLETARAAVASATGLQAAVRGEAMPVRAPVAARVLKVLHESEGAVAAGQPLIEIGNPESLEVEVEVLSTQAVRIAPGSRVVLDRWGNDQPVEGTVRTVEPSGHTKISALGVEEQRVRIIVDFTSPRQAWQRLGDGYRVEARFVLWQGNNVLQLPSSALFRHGKGWAVFRLERGRARLTPVEIGHRAGLVTQVLSGLSAGDRIVAHPDEAISNGVRVRTR